MRSTPTIHDRTTAPPGHEDMTLRRGVMSRTPPGATLFLTGTVSFSDVSLFGEPIVQARPLFSSLLSPLPLLSRDPIVPVHI